MNSGITLEGTEIVVTANDGLDGVISDCALNATHLQVVNAGSQEVLIALDCDA